MSDNSSPRLDRQRWRSSLARLASRLRSHRLPLSCALHLLLVLWLVHAPRVFVAPVRMPGTAAGTRMVLTYAPGRAKAQLTQALPDPHVAPRKTAPLKKQPTPAPPLPSLAAAPAPPSANPDHSTGNDGLGSGDVNIALLSFFPVPKPDLTQLPHGTRGDVVIDIVIDATGKIIELKMARGLGHGVDEAVLATVQQWTFHPATKDGHPVASEQELLFHYERS